MGIIVKSAVKELVKGKDVRISKETFEMLDKVVAEVLDKAIKRATENGRKTVQAQDI